MRIAIIGKAFSGLQKYLDSQGIPYTVFKDSKTPPKIQKPNLFNIDFTNLDEVINAVTQEHEIEAFDACTTLYEQYIVTTAKINKALGIPGMPVSAAEACTNKSIMRGLFAKAPHQISPEFQLVSSLSELKSFAETHAFPLILKPANLAKSLLVTKNHNLGELTTNYQKMLSLMDGVYDKYAPHNEKLILIEEFLDGSIHSVDAFVNGAGEPEILPYIVDYQTGYDIGYDDNFHYSRRLPSKLTEQAQKEFLKTAEVAIKCLGMKNSAAHVEIIVTKEGPRIVEIGARNGGYRERMHGLAQGIDIYGNLIRTITNQPLALEATKNEPCAVLELFPEKAGSFAGLENEEKLRGLPSTTYVSIKYGMDEYVGKSSDGYKAACVIILHNTDNQVFEKDLNFVNSKVFVKTKQL